MRAGDSYEDGDEEAITSEPVGRGALSALEPTVMDAY
jgi:hypothetical protein